MLFARSDVSVRTCDDDVKVVSPLTEISCIGKVHSVVVKKDTLVYGFAGRVAALIDGIDDRVSLYVDIESIARRRLIAVLCAICNIIAVKVVNREIRVIGRVVIHSTVQIGEGILVPLGNRSVRGIVVVFQVVQELLRRIIVVWLRAAVRAAILGNGNAEEEAGDDSVQSHVCWSLTRLFKQSPCHP